MSSGRGGGRRNGGNLYPYVQGKQGGNTCACAALFVVAKEKKEGEKCSGLILEIGQKDMWFRYKEIFHIFTQYTFAFALPSVAKQRSPWEEARNVLGSRSFFSPPPPFAACGLLRKSSFLPRFPHIHTGTYAHEEKESHGIKTLFKAINRLCRYISCKYQKTF